MHGPVPLLAHSSLDDLTAVPDISLCSGSGIKSPILCNPGFLHSKCPPRVHRTCFCVQFIAEHTKVQEDSTKVIDFLSSILNLNLNLLLIAG